MRSLKWIRKFCAHEKKRNSTLSICFIFLFCYQRKKNWVEGHDVALKILHVLIVLIILYNHMLCMYVWIDFFFFSCKKKIIADVIRLRSIWHDSIYARDRRFHTIYYLYTTIQIRVCIFIIYNVFDCDILLFVPESCSRMTIILKSRNLKSKYWSKRKKEWKGE